MTSDTELTVTSPPAQAAGTGQMRPSPPRRAPRHPRQPASSPTSQPGRAQLHSDPEPRPAVPGRRRRWGAGLVRGNQDALVLSAWDQAGQVRAANVVLRQGQLARVQATAATTVNCSSPGSAAPPMDDDRLLQVTSAVHSQIPAPASLTAAACLAQSVADVLAWASQRGRLRHSASRSGTWRPRPGWIASRLTTAKMPARSPAWTRARSRPHRRCQTSAAW